MPIIEIYAPIMSGTEFIKETPPKIKHWTDSHTNSGQLQYFMLISSSINKMKK